MTELEVIGLPDAARLLRARVPGLGQEIAELIAEELGRLPLALEQAVLAAADHFDRAAGQPGPGTVADAA